MSNLRVLVVDDEPMILQIMGEMLKRRGNDHALPRRRPDR